MVSSMVNIENLGTKKHNLDILADRKAVFMQVSCLYTRKVLYHTQ